MFSIIKKCGVHYMPSSNVHFKMLTLSEVW